MEPAFWSGTMVLGGSNEKELNALTFRQRYGHVNSFWPLVGPPFYVKGLDEHNGLEVFRV